jgi:hypothetical protein
MMAARGHTGLGHAGAVTLIPLHVALVSQGLLGIHGHIGHVVACRHVRVLRHARATSLGGEVGIGRFLWRINLIGAIDAVVASGRGFGCVQAGLR